MAQVEPGPLDDELEHGNHQLVAPQLGHAWQHGRSQSTGWSQTTTLKTMMHVMAELVLMATGSTPQQCHHSMGEMTILHIYPTLPPHRHHLHTS